MKILDTKKIKRGHPMEVVALAPTLLICILLNTLTLDMNPDNDLVYVVNNLSWWIGNLCFYLLILSVILRLIGALKSMSKK